MTETAKAAPAETGRPAQPPMMSGLSLRPVMVSAIGSVSDLDEPVAMDTAWGEVCRNPRASVPHRGDP